VWLNITGLSVQLPSLILTRRRFRIDYLLNNSIRSVGGYDLIKIKENKAQHQELKLSRMGK